MNKSQSARVNHLSLAIRQYDTYLNVLGDEFALQDMHSDLPRRENPKIADRNVVFIKNVELNWT